MINGGTGPYQGSLLLFNSGRGSLPSTIALANPKSPYNATILLDNYTGKQFNSLNDGKVHPKSGNIFFTDPSYGYLNRFRPAPQLPNQVYRFDPKTKAVKIVADRFDQPNGIAFTADGKTAYITDTGNVSKMSGVDKAQRSIIFAFDVDSTTEAFTNRRVFAYVDSGIPDGIQLDTNGNVYSGCGDGVHVWNSAGTLLGKFYIGTTSANMVFANGGDLFILAETKIYLARLGSAKGQNLST
jgi:gluconolactonase